MAGNNVREKLQKTVDTYAPQVAQQQATVNDLKMKLAAQSLTSQEKKALQRQLKEAEKALKQSQKAQKDAQEELNSYDSTVTTLGQEMADAPYLANQDNNLVQWDTSNEAIDRAERTGDAAGLTLAQDDKSEVENRVVDQNIDNSAQTGTESSSFVHDLAQEQGKNEALVNAEKEGLRRRMEEQRSGSVQEMPGVAISTDTEETNTKPMTVDNSSVDEKANAAVDMAEEKAKEKVENDNLIDKEAVDLDKLRGLYEDISDYGVAGMPTSIMNAYRSGLLGEVDSKDAKSARNQLILNQIFNTLGNAGAAWQGKEGTQSLWDTKTAKDWEEASNRKNDKLKTQMEQQLNLSGLAAEDQEKARAAIKDLTSDAYFTRAAQQLNNIEDTMGLFELKKAIGNEWGSMKKSDKQNVLAAYQLVANGNVDAAQNAVNSLPQSEQEKVGVALLNAQIKQAQANGTLTANQAALVNETVKNYGWIQGMQVLSTTLNTVGNLIP